MSKIDLHQVERILSTHSHRKKRVRPFLNRSAVAMILQQDESELRILMIKRAERDGDPWSGHMAFPGGRMDPIDRHGHDVAIRETEEETSLLIDEKWMMGDGKPVRSRDQSERGNVFFLARPPQKDILEDIGKNVFWTKHSLDL